MTGDVLIRLHFVFVMPAAVRGRVWQYNVSVLLLLVVHSIGLQRQCATAQQQQAVLHGRSDMVPYTRCMLRALSNDNTRRRE